jgi:hypothetical protein
MRNGVSNKKTLSSLLNARCLLQHVHQQPCYVATSVLLLLLLLLLVQALDKAFDMQADVCKAVRDVDFDQQLLNKVRGVHAAVCVAISASATGCQCICFLLALPPWHLFGGHKVNMCLLLCC